MGTLSSSDAVVVVQRLRSEVQIGLVGQEALLDGLIQALLANGHALIEGVPGLGKTRAVNLLARAAGTDFQRLQFTPDLLPADIVGTEIYNQVQGRFEIRKGPIFTSFVLADEINRAAPKVQSALLEAMQERQVTIGDETHRLPRPFFVFATQNPVEQEGTYPLPEAQVDRFLVKLLVDYPSKTDEKKIVRLVMDETELPKISGVLGPSDILALQAATREIFVENRIIDYATELVFATRRPKEHGLDLGTLIELGASPRATLAMVQVARASALMNGRDAVIPEDVKSAAPAVLRHRLLLSYHADAEGVTSDQLIDEILAKVKVP